MGPSRSARDVTPSIRARAGPATGAKLCHGHVRGSSGYSAEFNAAELVLSREAGGSHGDEDCSASRMAHVRALPLGASIAGKRAKVSRAAATGLAGGRRASRERLVYFL